MEYDFVGEVFTLHQLFAIPELVISLTTKRGNQWWLKGQYGQGLFPTIKGDFLYIRNLDSANQPITETSFEDIVLRQSWYNLILVYRLTLGKKD